MDTREVVSSNGAANVFGLAIDRFEYERIKTIPLSELRSLLDSAMSELGEQGLPCEIEYTIRAEDTGEIKNNQSCSMAFVHLSEFFGLVGKDRHPDEAPIFRMLSVRNGLNRRDHQRYAGQ
ncbi:MAG: hypothetical protein WCK63_07945 [Betaproteobacteria bacterium]